MDAQFRNESGKSFLSLTGELTIYHAENIRKEVMNAVFHEGERVEVNLSQVEEIDTCGMQVFILAKRESKKIGKEFVLVSHSSAVLELMDVFHLAEYFGDPQIISNKDTQ